MFAFIIALLFFGLLVSLLTIYKDLKPAERNKVTKVIGFEIKNVTKWLAICFVGVFVMSIGVLIYRLTTETKTTLKQQLIFDNVVKVEEKIINLDSLVKIQIDSLTEVLVSARGSASALNELDSVTKLAIKNRKIALGNFTKINKELQKGLDLNIQLSERNRKLSERLLINDFGGNSYAVVKPSIYINTGKTTFTLEILNVGEYPLKNVTVELYDLTAQKVCEKEVGLDVRKREYFENQAACAKNSFFNYRFPTLYTTKGIEKLEEGGNVPFGMTGNFTEGEVFHTITLSPNQKNLALRIIINSNNGRVVQFLDMVDIQEGNRYKICTAVVKSNPTQSLYYYKAHNYPESAYDKFFHGNYFYRQAIDPFYDYVNP